MALPIVLKAGTIAVYGPGSIGTMPSGAVLEPRYRFGTVYNIWAGGETYVYGGNVVYWEEGKQQARLATTGGNYTILPARLVTVDNYIP